MLNSVWTKFFLEENKFFRSTSQPQNEVSRPHPGKENDAMLGKVLLISHECWQISRRKTFIFEERNE